jgi:hypothetical protein
MRAFRYNPGFLSFLSFLLWPFCLALSIRLAPSIFPLRVDNISRLETKFPLLLRLPVLSANIASRFHEASKHHLPTDGCPRRGSHVRSHSGTGTGTGNRTRRRGAGSR